VGFEAVSQGRSTVINGHASAESVPEAGPASPRHLFKQIWGWPGYFCGGGGGGVGDGATAEAELCALFLTFQGLVFNTTCTTRSNIQNFYILPTRCIYVFLCRSQTKQRLFPTHYPMIRFYTRHRACLLSGTEWTIWISFRFKFAFKQFVLIRCSTPTVTLQSNISG